MNLVAFAVFLASIYRKRRKPIMINGAASNLLLRKWSGMPSRVEMQFNKKPSAFFGGGEEGSCRAHVKCGG